MVLCFINPASNFVKNVSHFNFKLAQPVPKGTNRDQQINTLAH